MREKSYEKKMSLWELNMIDRDVMKNKRHLVGQKDF